MKIVNIRLPEKSRIICVSDMHGYCDDFKNLLKKCGYNEKEDYLFILGDLLEKGKQNIEILRYVKELCKSEKTICIQGNNDTMCERMAFRDDKEKFLSRLASRPENTFLDMAKELGISDFSENFEYKREKVVNAFYDDLAFVRDLPFAINTEDYLFVHAGIENRTDWENSSERVIQAEPWWIRGEHCLDKTVVVGHFPCYNFARGNNSNLPIFDFNKRMINIDGGCATKWAGQINVLIIEKDGKDYKYNTVFQPLVQKSIIAKDYESPASYTYLDYEKCDLEIIENDGVFLKVKNRYDNAVGVIPACCTSEWGGKLHGWINLDSFLTVNKGESFYVYGEISGYYFGIADNCQVGLIPKSCIDS